MHRRGRGGAVDRAQRAGAAGNRTKLIPLPAYLPSGFSFFAQARVARGGATLRTNSVPIVLR